MWLFVLICFRSQQSKYNLIRGKKYPAKPQSNVSVGSAIVAVFQTFVFLEKRYNVNLGIAELDLLLLRTSQPFCFNRKPGFFFTSTCLTEVINKSSGQESSF